MDSQKKNKKNGVARYETYPFHRYVREGAKKMIRYDQDLSIIHETILLTFLRVLGRSNLFNSDDQFVTNKREKNNKIKLTATYRLWHMVQACFFSRDGESGTPWTATTGSTGRIMVGLAVCIADPCGISKSVAT